MVWLMSVLAGGGAGVLSSIFMEAYFQRRAQDVMGDYDPGMETSHRAG